MTKQDHRQNRLIVRSRLPGDVIDVTHIRERPRAYSDDEIAHVMEWEDALDAGLIGARAAAARDDPGDDPVADPDADLVRRRREGMEAALRRAGLCPGRRKS